MTYKTQKMGFVGIHAGINDSPLDLQPETHLHMMPLSIVNDLILFEANMPNQLASHTLISVGTISSIIAGEFNTGFNEEMRLNLFGNYNFGICARSVPVADGKWALNHDCMIANYAYHNHYNGTNDVQFSVNGVFPIFQVVNFADSFTATISSANNFTDFDQQVENHLQQHGFNTSSYAFYFNGYIDTNSDARLVKGFNEQGDAYEDLCQIFNDARILTEEESALSHVVSYNSIQVDEQKVWITPINRKLVLDPKGSYDEFGMKWRDVSTLTGPAALGLVSCVDINSPENRDPNGDTGLHVAVQYGESYLVRYALDVLHADKTIVNEAGQTALDLACNSGNEDIIALLGNCDSVVQEL